MVWITNSSIDMIRTPVERFPFLASRGGYALDQVDPVVTETVYPYSTLLKFKAKFTHYLPLPIDQSYI